MKIEPGTFESVPFTHPMIQESAEIIKRIAEELEDAIRSNVSSPRHVAVATTRLEEVVMWANKGLKNDQAEINFLTSQTPEDYGDFGPVGES
jgi:hypothetical protein